MPSTPSDRLILFLKMAGGQTAVAEKTGITRATFSNIMRNRSKPSFAVTKALLEAYPAFNLRWWFLGGDEPIWIDKPKDVDYDLVNYVEEEKSGYISKKNIDYSEYKKGQLIELLEEKETIINSLLRGQNESVYVQKEQLKVLDKILQKIEKQRDTLEDT